MARIGRLVRGLHNLLAQLQRPAGDRLLTHGDLGPWNVVASDDGQLVVIDWDSLEVRPRLWEVAYAAWAFVPLMDRNETDAIGWSDAPPDHASRLVAFCHAYGLERAEVPGLLDAVPAICAEAAGRDTDGGVAAAINQAFIDRYVDAWRKRLDTSLG